MNSASKVGEIFLAAGNSYSQLGEAVMSLYNQLDKEDGKARSAVVSVGESSYRRPTSPESGSEGLLPDVNLMLRQHHNVNSLGSKRVQ